MLWPSPDVTMVTGPEGTPAMILVAGCVPPPNKGRERLHRDPDRLPCHNRCVCYNCLRFEYLAPRTYNHLGRWSGS
jgi:hypothetical protein